MNVPQVKVHHRDFYQERIDLIVASQKIVMLKKISTYNTQNRLTFHELGRDGT